MKPDDTSTNLDRKQGQFGLYDLSGFFLTDHAKERFEERFGCKLEARNHEQVLSKGMSSCRKLGTNHMNQAQAYLCLFEEIPSVLIVQGTSILTFITCEQFETVMADFGRLRWPKKPGRWLRRIKPNNKTT